MKRLLISLSILLSFGIQAQNEQCHLQQSKFISATTVDKEDLICIAKNSQKPYTIFYTLASWCGPCRLHLPDTLDLEKTGMADVFVLLVEAEQDQRINSAISFIKNTDEKVKYVVLKDEVYGTKVGKRNRKFVSEITPSGFENIDDYSKVILMDKSGNTIYVSNWKDYNKDWKNSKKMYENKIIPLLK